MSTFIPYKYLEKGWIKDIPAIEVTDDLELRVTEEARKRGINAETLISDIQSAVRKIDNILGNTGDSRRDYLNKLIRDLPRRIIFAEEAAYEKIKEYSKDLNEYTVAHFSYEWAIYYGYGTEWMTIGLKDTTDTVTEIIHEAGHALRKSLDSYQCKGRSEVCSEMDAIHLVMAAGFDPVYCEDKSPDHYGAKQILKEFRNDELCDAFSPGELWILLKHCTGDIRNCIIHNVSYMLLRRKSKIISDITESPPLKLKRKGLVQRLFGRTDDNRLKYLSATKEEVESLRQRLDHPSQYLEMLQEHVSKGNGRYGNPEIAFLVLEKMAKAGYLYAAQTDNESNEHYIVSVRDGKIIGEAFFWFDYMNVLHCNAVWDDKKTRTKPRQYK